jgi:hypothetical protein
LGAQTTVGAAGFNQAPALRFQFQTKISRKSPEIPVTVTLISDASGNAIEITVSLPPSRGDLLGFFGDLTDEGPIPSMGVYDPAGLVTDQPFAANAVWNLLNPNRWGYS